MAFVERGGADIWWDAVGSGVPVLLINGLGSPSVAWYRLVGRLSATHRVITFDNRGTGRSSVPDGPYTVATMAADAVAVLDAAGVAAAHVVGISMGGLIAQEVALEAPRRVLSLVLASAHVGLPHAGEVDPEVVRVLTEAAALSTRERMDRLAPLLYAPGTPQAEIDRDHDVRETSPTSETGYANQLAGVVGWERKSELAGLRVPTLVLHGAQDRLVPVRDGQALANAIPGAELSVVDGAGHEVFTDQEAEAARRVRAFVESATPPLVAFIAWLGRPDVTTFDELWEWSVRDITAFWSAIWEFFQVGPRGDTVLADATMPGARWFPGTEVNYAEHVFRSADGGRPALVAVHEDGTSEEWSWDRLRAETGAIAAHLRSLDVAPGDRVVGYLPNVPETIAAFLATASVGAVWAVCNLDVAVPGVLDRFAQLDPAVLIAAEGTTYGGKDHDRRNAVTDIEAGLPTLRGTVRLGEQWRRIVATPADLDFADLPFDHPLWVLFSSGSTGTPKGIVHGHGGVLLEHLKFLSFHLDARPGDRLIWHCSTSWVMWNILTSALLTRCTTVLYDGSPTVPHTDRLWRIAEEHGIDVFGVSPAYLAASAKDDVRPARVRVVGSTGAPLPEAAARWVGERVGVEVNSLSGGTDVAAAFVAGNPLTTAEPGEIGGRCLGVAAQAWSPDGESLVGEVGELVITQPMPSMPIYLWRDDHGSRYRQTYFDTYPGVWRQGDWITFTARGTAVIHGRSDATLNRNGVRFGSAEVYQAVESLPEVTEALVVGVEQPGGGYWMPLFVHLAPGHRLTPDLRTRITDRIRSATSPRHVPDEVIEVPGLPHTLTGKRLEVPVKRILMGLPTAEVLTRSAVDDPDLLAPFEALAAQRRVSHP